MSPAGPPNNEPIAIIGTGCRFPGSSSAPAKLWELLQEPRDLRQKLPESRFNPDGVFHPDGKRHGTSNVKHSYILDEDHRHFDAQFFGIKPLEADCIDPQQRHLLEVVYEGLEAAGQRLEDLQGSSTAVYVGLMYGEYGEMLTQYPDDIPTYTATGTARSIMANRISYFFDWHGPCMTIDTACSSSLVALHHAVQALRLGESSVAVAAGSNLCLGPESYIAESNLQMLSPNGRSRMWDAEADGYARGDGVAAVVLKKLKDAIADGDDIECVIRETAVNQDGRTKGITMPSTQAQAELIRAAYTRAGLDLSKTSDRPQYFEAHGTGTPTGDPLEAAAIHQAFFSEKNSKEFPKLYVGSIKSIIGHTEGTAGLAGVIKASLAIQNRRIPPNLWFHNLNPAIKPHYTHLTVPSELIEWPIDPSVVPRASVNSFGFGGTNAHAILEAMPTKDAGSTSLVKPDNLPFAPLAFSTQSKSALLRMLSRYAQHLKNNKGLDATDLAYTLNSRRSQFDYRYAFGLDPKQSLLENFETQIKLLQDKDAQVTNMSVKSGSVRILGVFTGQGAQYGGMLKELYSRSSTVRERIEEFQTALDELPEALRPSWSLKEELLKTGADSRLGEAALSQPLSTVVQIILVDILCSMGLQFGAVVGHSSGEIAAAYAAGFLRATDAVRIAYLRGYVTSAQTDSKAGRMLAVGTSYEDAESICSLPDLEGRIRIAAINSSSSLTLSGDADAVEYAKDILDDEGKFARLLKVDKAYHSHHMLRFVDTYMDCLRQCEVTVQNPPPDSPIWISSVQVDSIREAHPDLSSGYWVRNLTQPVLFHQAITKAALNLESIDMAIEVGPHPALKGPASQSLQEALEDSVPYTGLLSRDKDSTKAIADGIAQIWMTLGQAAHLDLEHFEEFLSQAGSPRVLKGLPTYAWTHERLFWHEARGSRLRRSRKTQANLLLGHRSTEDPGQQFRWRNVLTPREIPWLSDHRIQSQRIFPAAGYISVAIEAAAAMSEGNEMSLIELQDISLGSALNFDEEDSRVEVLCTLTDIEHEQQQDTSVLTAKFQYFSVAANDAGPMLLNAEGRLVVHYGSGSKDMLPPSPEIEPGLIDVDHDRFYESLVPLGYGYTGPFRALSSLKRKLGAVHGLVSQPAEEDSPLLIHPAMLDCTIQAVLLAFSWPGDGRLWSLHIPNGIKNVIVNPKLSPAAQNIVVPHFSFNTSLTDDDTPGVTGNVLIHSTGGSTLLRMEGVHAVPLERASPDTDRRLFSKVVWGVAAPDAETAARGERASPDDYKRAELLERVSHFYLKRLDNAFPANDQLRSEGPWVGMLGFAHQTVEAVSQGYHVCARTDWVDDDESIIEAEIQKFPDNIDLKIARIVGKHIVGVVRGESNMLEHLRGDDTLDDYYANAMGTHYTEYIARIARQLSFKHPDLNFLEIGAGTGAATKSIFREIGNSLGSYTFTDISGAFFETAQTNFGEHIAKMTFNTLDIERDIEQQGYRPHSYDVVVASFVVHATRNLHKTLTNIRRLLKPGGYLLLLEVTNLNLARINFVFGSLPGWWLGEEPHRRYTACVDASQWGELLLESGFSGVDTITPDQDPLPFPVSAIVSQAVDDQVCFLRDPLYCDEDLQSSRASSNLLLVVGGRSPRVSKMSRVIKGLVAQCFSRGVSNVQSLAQLQPTDFDTYGTTVLCLEDLDKAVFDGLDDQQFRGLKTLFNNAKKVFWITNQANDSNPFHLMSIGFGRSMQMEMPHVRTQYIDLAEVGPEVASTVSEMLLRFEGLTPDEGTSPSEQMLWSVEPELRVDSGKQLIQRMIPDEERNYRYNSIRRDVTLDVSVGSGTPVEISPGANGYDLLPQRAQKISGLGDSILIDTRFSTIPALRLDEDSNLHVCMGFTADVGRPMALLSDKHATKLAVPQKLVVDCQEVSPRCLANLATAIVGGSIVRTFSEHIVVMEPDAELAFAIRAHAASKPISILFLTTDATNTQPHHQYIHPSIGISELDRVIPRGCRQVLLTGRNEQAEFRIKTWAQSRGVKIVDSLRVSQAYRSTRSSLESLQNLLQSSLEISRKLQKPSFEVVTLPDIARLSPARLPRLATPILDSSPAMAPVKIEPVDKNAMLRVDRTYWLVGLSRSLGLSLCKWMIEHGARHVVISSRSPIVDRAALQALTKNGAVVKVLPCNVVDKQSVVATHNLIKTTMPPIAGVANGAMVLRDTMLDEMTVEEMNAVICPKVIGSMNLHELFLNTPLDFFIFLSSAIAITGNVGQCNYAVANMFMHGLAAKRRKNGLAASVVVIGVILGVGYVTRETSQTLRDNLKKSGHTWMSEQDFHVLFAEAIEDSPASRPYQSEIVVGLKTIRQDEDHMPPWASNPRFSHLILRGDDGGAAVSTSTEKIPLRTMFLEATSMQEIYDAFEDGLYRHIVSMLRMGDSVPQHQLLKYNAGSLGIDSLNAVDLRTWFMKEAKVDVPVLRILGGSSLEDLLRFALDLLSTDVAPAKSDNFKPAAKPPTSSPSAPSKPQPIETEQSKPVSFSDPKPTAERDDRPRPVTSDENRASTPLDPAATLNLAESSEFRAETSNQTTSSTSDDSLGDSISLINESLQSSTTSEKDSGVMIDSVEVPASQHIVRSEQLSHGQSRFWFLQSYVEDPTTFNITCLFRIQGPIDVARLQKAVLSVGRRHEALRTAVSDSRDGTLEQNVLEKSSLYLEIQQWFGSDDHWLKYRELEEHEYDLNEGKLMRMVLLSPGKSSSSVHFLCIGYHHINMDGVSLQIILKELADLYSGHSLGKDPYQFANHAIHEHQQLSSGAWDQHLSYWKGRLSPVPEVYPILSFAESGIRQTLNTYGHVKASFMIDSGTKRLIQRACKTYKVSPYHFYLASYLVLLARWGGLSEVCIGSSYANRHDSDRQSSVGLYLNPVGLRLPYDGKHTFVSAIETAKKLSDEASMHSEVPFEVVLDRLQVQRDPASSPVFQTFINYRPRTDESMPFGPGCSLTGIEYNSGKTPYDIMLDVFDGQESESRVEISLQESLYPQAAAETLGRNLVSLVKAFARNQIQRLAEPSLHDDRDIQRAVNVGKGRDMTAAWGPTVIHHLEDVCKMNPARVAIRHQIDHDATFTDMAKRVDRLYQALSDCNVPAGAPVGVHMKASYDWVCSMLAIMKFGAIYVPLDSHQGQPRLLAIIKECQAATILVDEETCITAKELYTGTKMKEINVSRIGGSANRPTPIRGRGPDQAAFYYTSGSTGVPKGIPLTHEGICNHMEAMADRLGVSPDDVVLQQTAFSFDFSLWQILVGLTNAAAVTVVPDKLRKDAIGTVDLMVKSNVTMTATTPSEYSSWLRYGASKLRTSAWRRILCGGEPMPHSLLKDLQMLGKPDLKLEHLYGPTEITFIATTCHLDYWKEYAIIPIGRALPNYTICILDKDGQPVPTGVLGEITIGSVGVATEYLNMPEESGQKFRSRSPALSKLGISPSRFHMTGDEGWLSEEGLLYIRGRIAGDTQVKLRGQRLDLLEVEEAIVGSSSGAVFEANVSACRDADGTAFLVAQVVLRPGALETDLPGLAASLPLPPFMRPSIIFAVDAFPVTEHGKRDRRALANLDVSRLLKPKKTEDIEFTPMQKQIFAIWGAVLPKETLQAQALTPDTDFFAIGGNSLSVIEVQRRIRKDIGPHVEVAALFASSSLKGMASLADERAQEKEAEAEEEIDWDRETQLDISRHEFVNAKSMKDWTAPDEDADGLSIILTGATGFLGKQILRALIANAEVAKVHCLAVRHAGKLSEFSGEAKVHIHAGDLGSPRLGLSQEEACEVFSTSQVIVHNGADVSFLKTYASLRQVNVQSTRELIKLSMSYIDGGHDLHYISTAGVVGFSGEKEFPPMTASGFQPPRDGSFGYSASKWASERILERASEAYGLPVSIYRPSNITGDQTPELDLVHNVVNFSRTLKVVPDPTGIWDGFINFVSVDDCSGDIVSSVLRDAHGREPGIQYMHVAGPEDIPVDGLKSHLERSEGVRTWYKQVGLSRWVAKAERAGLSHLTGAYLKKLASEKRLLYLTRVIRDQESPSEHSSDKESTSSWNVLKPWRRGNAKGLD